MNTKKKVNINSPSVLYIFTPPLSGVFNNVELSLGDIRACLMQGAKVEEVLPNGKTVRLYLDNYDKDHLEPVKVDVQIPVETKVETPKTVIITDKVEVDERIDTDSVKPKIDETESTDIDATETEDYVEEVILEETSEEVEEVEERSEEVETEELRQNNKNQRKEKRR